MPFMKKGGYVYSLAQKQTIRTEICRENQVALVPSPQTSTKKRGQISVVIVSCLQW